MAPSASTGRPPKMSPKEVILSSCYRIPPALSAARPPLRHIRAGVRVALLYFGSQKHYETGVWPVSLRIGSTAGNRDHSVHRAVAARQLRRAPRFLSRVGILKKSSLWMSAAGALVFAVLMAGCGSTTYFAGRTLPPSGLTNRVLVAIQNPSALTKGALQIMDAYYDIRFSYNDKTGSFSISGY